MYEIIKTIYNSPDSSSSDETRVSVLQNTLGQLRLANIATLDAITTHFTRLIELTSADDEFVSNLATALAPCILRPRVESSLTMQERHAYRLVRDLFDHKEAIFGELKRASAQNNVLAQATSQPRVRAPSGSDESNRRQKMEERNKLIASNKRAVSPGPAGMSLNGRHRRDRSVGTAEGRFPVVTSPTSTTDAHRRPVRQSLEVPDSGNSTPTRHLETPSPPTDTPTRSIAEAAFANGGAEHNAPAQTSASTPAEDPKSLEDAATSGVEKKNSLTRSGHVAAAANRLNRKGQPSIGSGASLNMLKRNSLKNNRDSVSSIPESSTQSDEARGVTGVELTDRPMNDF